MTTGVVPGLTTQVKAVSIKQSQSAALGVGGRVEEAMKVELVSGHEA